jgi:diadenylate cyclase
MNLPSIHIPHVFLSILDVLIVAALLYRMFLIIRGTRAAQMFVGLVGIVLTSIVARWIQLDTLNWIINNLTTVWVIAFVILFQPELRRALAVIGQSRWVGSFLRVEAYGMLGEVVRAVEDMATHRIGALIVFERDLGLRNYEETGRRIDARVSAELIETIFTPGTPLHDGALIIRGETAVAAGCLLPLSQNPLLPTTLGTRHRAALGLAEETDAVVLVVSEDRGTVGLAHRGRLLTDLDEGRLRAELAQIFGPPKEGTESPQPVETAGASVDGVLSSAADSESMATSSQARVAADETREVRSATVKTV